MGGDDCWDAGVRSGYWPLSPPGHQESPAEVERDSGAQSLGQLLEAAENQLSPLLPAESRHPPGFVSQPLRGSASQSGPVPDPPSSCPLHAKPRPRARAHTHTHTHPHTSSHQEDMAWVLMGTHKWALCAAAAPAGGAGL